MAQKRMFDRAIIDTDRFMDLPMSAKAMYFLLGMEADDEGFVSYKKVLRIHGGNDDDVRLLIAKEFLVHFPSGVVVITDWNVNNWLDSRRVRPTEYKNEKASLLLTDDKRYVLSNGLAVVKPEEYRVEENSIEQKKEAKPLPARYGEFKNVVLTDEEKQKLIDRYGRSAARTLTEELSSYMQSHGKRYKDHYATLLNWAKRKGVVEVTHKAAPVEDTSLTPEQVAANKERLDAMRENLAGKLRSR